MPNDDAKNLELALQQTLIEKLKAFEQRLNNLENDSDLRLPSNSLGKEYIPDDPIYETLKQELEEIEKGGQNERNI